MYGMVARMRAILGTEAQLQALMCHFETQVPPAGYRSTHVYRMDDDPNTYFVAVIVESKAAYVANA